MRKRILTLIALMAVPLLVAQPVGAKATKTTFTGIECAIATFDEGTVTHPGGNTHIRGREAVDREDAVDEPRMTGRAYLYANANLDANGVGPLWGTWTITPDGPFEGGIWEGQFTGMAHADGSRSFGRVGHGRGDFEGQKVIMTIEYEPPPTVPPWCGTFTGRILDPHGG